MQMKNESGDKKNQPPYLKSVKEYSQATTIHGISYLFENRLILYEKALWFLFVTLALIFAVLSSLSSYQKWVDEPILTSVSNTAYPVQKVPFPSITICPQGAANDIVDAAIFKQFVDYIEEKNLSYDELTDSEIQQETYHFLNDKYPGSRQLPNQLVRMLGSPDVDPENKIEARAILNPEDVSDCSSPNETQKKTNTRKRRSPTYGNCPNDFIETDHGSCWNISTQSMTYDDALAYCNNLGNGAGEILWFLDDHETTKLYETLKPTGKIKNAFDSFRLGIIDYSYYPNNHTCFRLIIHFKQFPRYGMPCRN